MSHPLSLAPMMDVTDRHFRYFLRQLSRHTLLYTEMVTTGAILHGKRYDLLDYDEAEHPLVLQLGGDDPKALAECAKIAEDLGYDEVNLNVGCPSDRVQRGRFGACLMAHPEEVAEMVASMRQSVKIPISIKHRIGIDDKDSYEDFFHFVTTVAQAKPVRFSIHARKAWLKGLSPEENRNIPPLRYDEVYQLKRELPDLCIEINGGITTWPEIEKHLEHVDGVMIGRAAKDNPYLFAEADKRLFRDRATIYNPSRREVVEKMISYIEKEGAKGTALKHISRSMLNLFKGLAGSRAWKRYISEHAHLDGADERVILTAMSLVPDRV
ncbi:MAG: tRNA dihydrouridine(20/20a) synthase DusA [Deinococcales bacterium]